MNHYFLFKSWIAPCALVWCCFIASLPVQAQCNCDHTVPFSEQVVFDGTQENVMPGDTICVEAGITRDRLHFKNIVGTQEAPVVIINCGGQVVIQGTGSGGSNVPLALNGNRYFHLTGTGDPAYEYGFKAGGESHATVEGQGRATNFELDHIEVFSAGFAGFMLKTDPDGSGNNARPNSPDAINGGFTMYDISVHDCYIHDMLPDGEGIYMGNSFWSSGHNGQLPHSIYGAKIYNNVLERTGREAIQAGAVVEGLEIYNNRIYQYGYQNETNSQNNAIQVGEGSTGRIYNNYIEAGPGGGTRGIYMLGLGDNYVYNNIIIGTKRGAIVANFRPGPLEGEEVQGGGHFLNNTIIDTEGEVAFESYLNPAPENFIYNNMVITSLEEWNTMANYSNWESSNNLVYETLAEAGLIEMDGEYSLDPQAEAIDAGLDVSADGVNDDFYSVPRPINGVYDVGALEYGSSGNKAPILSTIGDTSVFEGDTLFIDISATDLDGDPVSFTASNLPSFAAFTDNGDNTATLTFTPQIGEEGLYSGIKVNAEDGNGGKDFEIIDVTVVDPINDAPLIVPIQNTSVEETEVFVITVRTSDDEEDDLQLGSQNLPSFITFTDNGDNTGTITIAPETGDNGYYPNLKITADDGVNQTEETFAVTVVELGNNGVPIYRVNAGGVVEPDDELDWIGDKKATPAPYFSSNSVNYTSGSNGWNGVNNTHAPNNIFGPYRYDNNASFASRQLWSFPVEPGEYEVRLFFNAEADSIGQHIFDIAMEDSLVKDDYDIYSVAGGKDIPIEEFFKVTVNDSVLNITFPEITAGVSLVNGIEIRSFSVSACGPMALTLHASNTSCTGEEGGVIMTTLTGGCAPYRYEWSTGDTTDTISELEPGLYILTVYDSLDNTVTDSATITEPTPAVDTIILDNAAATLTGAWTVSTAGGSSKYGADYLHDGSSGKGDKSASYSTFLTTGTYEVFGWWFAFSNRSTNTPFDIVHAEGTTTVHRDQQINDGQWVSLGTYSFCNTAEVVVRNDSTSGYVAADAIRFVPVSNTNVASTSVTVQYKVRQHENNASDNHIRPFFQLVNTSDEAIPYNELVMRYWYTREYEVYPWAQDNSSQQFWVDYAAIGRNYVQGAFAELENPEAGVDSYVEISFTTPNLLDSGASSGEIQTRFNNANWADYNETDDYSYGPDNNEYTDWDKVTLYRKQGDGSMQLIWGIEPEGASTARIATVVPGKAPADWNVYPNPAPAGNFTIEVKNQPEGESTLLQLIDFEGREVLSRKIDYRLKIENLNLNPGLYIIKLINAGDITVKKLRVE
ncbi:MAG: cellulose binding domain-containing protein [Cyclobacteriaceae bacterium]